MIETRSKFVADIAFSSGPRCDNGLLGKVTIIVEGFEIREGLDGGEASTIQEAIEYLLPEKRRIAKIEKA